MKIKVRGKFKKDSNFIYVYSEDTLYTLARNSSDWGAVRIGERTASGALLDQATFEEWKDACTKEGVFELALE